MSMKGEEHKGNNLCSTHSQLSSPLHHVFHILKHTTPHTWHTPPPRKRQREQEEEEATKTKKAKEWKQEWEVWIEGERGWREGVEGGEWRGEWMRVEAESKRGQRKIRGVKKIEACKGRREDE